MTLSELHPCIQTSVLHLANPTLSYSEIGAKYSISKQAAAKRIAQGCKLLAALGKAALFDDDRDQLVNERDQYQAENIRLQGLLKDLRLQMVLHGVVIFMLTCLKERIQAFFPRFKLTRLRPLEKWKVLDFWWKYQRLGGTLKDFAKAAGRSVETLRDWLAAFEKHGMAGLADKTTRPHHFGHKLPVWIRDQLLQLFLRYPQWTPYQYHKYIRMNPAINYSVSVPTIEKLKEQHRVRSQEERDRLKKLWCFSPTTDVWTIDFTCLLKTERYKLQLLTVSDHRSRFVLDSALFLETSTEQVIDHLTDLFIIYGKPFMIKADNGPEFRMDARTDLEGLGVYLLSSPVWYGQFCGAHERIHRELKTYIVSFDLHRNLQRLVNDITNFKEDHNHHWPLEILDHKTPAQVFYSEADFVPRDREVVTPYVKNGELRMKFTNRNGDPARMALPLIPMTETSQRPGGDQTSGT